ncbi:3-hydroxy-9,10-secoandrosta-1,3,5(10)-triene-9,17-dione monooxygenase reductase subunit [Cryptosporangium arvum]|uniref:3-hydroxy-9,10-secoandrosta-1,3,5(10)-triene-9, 17-dione monooxygenase reductase subunit n=1 Tax=Cryptosporangium arvum TaxID=80871 RepID=UPI00055F41E3|nr:3-hydroxy-9,10-secoandrosta-1,3,5(10)-triene-9,17-dione monooxygenase reductase subunit [Cryptosporangium arvum]
MTSVSAPTVDPGTFRSVLGQFCTGVTVVTASLDGEPVGFACQSFSALSLEPPLVVFCPSATSRSWPVIARAGTFCVNVLGADQAEVSAVFGARRADKFDVVGWSAAPSGSPVLHGALAWIDCRVEAVYPGGDHQIVVGRVDALEAPGAGHAPLLFHRGRYTATSDPEPWFAWPEPDDWI